MYKQEELKELEKKIGYEFSNRKLLGQAVTHSSFSNEQKINKLKNYERLEFLGDAVLELLSSQFFFETYPDMSEGEMTRLRSSMVCEPALAFCARDLDLGSYILLGKGEEATGGRKREADKFVRKFILSDLENKQLFYDSKTLLQEQVQKEGKTLTYELVSESGPDHEKVFVVEAKIDGKTVGRGRGRNKKTAQQQAAYQVLIGEGIKEQE